LKLPATAPALLLPNPAIQRQASRIGVWRVEGGTLRFLPVRTGQTSLDGWVQVLDGLKAGDEVVVYSEKELTATRRIEVVDSLTRSNP
jgi:HlyD family secretion protein